MIKILYHYTTQQGLFGILKQKSILSSNIFFQNDRNEFYHGITLVKNYLMNKYKIPKKELQLIIDDILSHFQWANIFTFSLSEENDLLSQWRGYTGSDSGYAIGFKVDILASISKSIDYELLKCIYCNNYEQIIEHLDGVFSLGANNRIRHDYFKIYKLLSVLKDSGFNEEKEYRLVSTSKEIIDPAIVFFPGKNMIKSFYSIDFKLAKYCDLIDSITIGPNHDQDLAEKALLNFLKSINAYDVKIVKSKIPYRQ